MPSDRRVAPADRLGRSVAFLLALAGLAAGLTALGDQPSAWRSLAPGLELGSFEASRPSAAGEARITVLRIDPERWELVLAGLSLTGESTGKTARQWAESHRLTAAINAGMFATDYKTHVGYLRSGTHVNSQHVNDYQSVAAFGPKEAGDLPRFRIFDLDEPGAMMESIRRAYDLVAQNLRLIKRPGSNRWSQQSKKWSEAALGEDESGRILFIFCRAPFSMHDLNRELLSLGIGLVAAQHLEGGPEAQLFLRAGDFELELFGSYETLFREDDGNDAAWPVPNVLGVRPRAR